jgi:hypothetical protein
MFNVHTYPFKEWDWEFEATILDPSGMEMSRSGNLSVRNENNSWKVISFWKETDHESLEEKEKTVVITPLEYGKNSTKWTSLCPTGGKMAGLYVFHEDKIISHYIHTRSGIFQTFTGIWGCDFYQMMDENKYSVNGALFKSPFFKSRNKITELIEWFIEPSFSVRNQKYCYIYRMTMIHQ